MLKIGEFSKIAQVSIKALRHYDRLGLLKPAHIDRYSGYRYYELSQLVTLNRILALKDLDFSLDQIKELLKVDLSREVLQKLLHKKAAELQQRILDEHARLIRVEGRLAQLQDNIESQLNPVVLKSSPRQWIAAVRQILPSINDLYEWRQEQLTEIDHCIQSADYSASEQTILIYHQDEYHAEDVDVEVGRFLIGKKHFSQKEVIKGSLQIHTLPAVNHLATTIHTAESANMSETYARLAGWTQTNGFRPIGP
jgi:DNA-binding transcriptional MerR regulator